MALQYSRRAVLQAATGVGLTGAVGYGGARLAAKQGTIVVRHVGGRTMADDGQRRNVDVFHEEANDDGTVDRTVDPEYRDLFADTPPVTVSAATHDELTDRLSDVTYWLGHRCPNARCSTPQVSRRAFNGARVGETEQLLYHGSSATVVPP